MPHWKTYVRKNSKFLTSEDIAGHTPLTVTVAGYSMEKAHNPGDHEDGELLALEFEGKTKKLGMNNTNSFIAEKITGEGDPAKWIGKKLVLRTAVCKDDDCIRLDVPPDISFPGHYPKFTYTDAAKPKGAK